MSKQQAPRNYEDMSLDDMNAYNDELGREIEALQNNRREFNEVRKLKARMENLVPRLEAAGHDTSKMSYEEMEAVITRIKDRRTPNPGEQLITMPVAESTTAATRG